MQRSATHHPGGFLRLVPFLFSSPGIHIPGPVLNVCDNKPFPPVQSIIHYSRSEIRLSVIPCVQPQAFALFVHHVLPFSFPPRMKNHQAFMHCRKFVHCVPVQNTASICKRSRNTRKFTARKIASRSVRSFRSFAISMSIARRTYFAPGTVL